MAGPRLVKSPVDHSSAAADHNEADKVAQAINVEVVVVVVVEVVVVVVVVVIS